MRIERRKGDRREPESPFKDFLEPDSNEERPCGPGCQRVCPTCGSVSCQCACSPDCEHIPTALSSDPENYPLETGIAPLVYALKKTGHYHPCWSCEGHMDLSGERIWKIPRVWFYCNSTTHIRLLADVIQDFRVEHLIQVPWQVKVSFSDEDNPDTTFSLRPDMAGQEDVTLEQLQKDVHTIAEKLNDALRARAEKIRDIIVAKGREKTD